MQQKVPGLHAGARSVWQGRLTCDATLSNSTTLPPLSPVARCWPVWSNSTAEMMSAAAPSEEMLGQCMMCSTVYGCPCRGCLACGLHHTCSPASHRDCCCWDASMSNRQLQQACTFLDLLARRAFSKALQELPFQRLPPGRAGLHAGTPLPACGIQHSWFAVAYASICLPKVMNAAQQALKAAPLEASLTIPSSTWRNCQVQCAFIPGDNEPAKHC